MAHDCKLTVKRGLQLNRNKNKLLQICSIVI